MRHAPTNAAKLAPSTITAGCTYTAEEYANYVTNEGRWIVPTDRLYDPRCPVNQATFRKSFLRIVGEFGMKMA